MKALFITLLGAALAGTADVPATEQAAPETAPAPVAAPAPALHAPVSWALDEHTTVVLVEDHRVPLVELRVEVPAGSWTPWLVEHHGEEAWSLQHYDPEGELRARADALAADITFDVRQQRSLMSVSCLKRDLPEVLTLVGEIFANTDIDGEELKREQKNREIGWESQVKDPMFRAQQAGHRLLFAEGDPRRIPYEEPADLEKDGELLIATRDAMLRLPGRRLGFAGDLTREEVEAIAGGLLPPAEAAPEGLEPVFLPLNAREATAAEPMPDLTQVYFAYLREGPDWDAADYAAWRVADHILGGHFFSRLYVALRHEGGETYGASTRGEGAAQPEAYAMFTFTRVENRETTEAKLRATLQKLYDDGVTEQELADAVGYFAGSRLMDRQSPGQVLDDVLWEMSNDRPEGWEDQLIEAGRALTVDQVNAAIKAFYDPANFTMLTVEPE